MTGLHTPTPWRVRAHGEDCFIEAEPNNAIKAYGIEIMGDDTHPDHYPDAQKQADAAFIVKACNVHAALVSAAKLAQEQLSLWVENEDEQSPEDREALDALANALAAARGEA